MNGGFVIAYCNPGNFGIDEYWFFGLSPLLHLYIPLEMGDMFFIHIIRISIQEYQMHWYANL